MASIEQTRREAMGGTVGFFGTLGAALRGIGLLRTSQIEAVAARPRAEMSEVFARALHESSDSAMDWMYYAAQLHDDERRHCIGRAVELAYGDPIVMREIHRLRCR